MKQILLKNKKVLLAEVPTPIVGSNNVLVKVFYSCISPGTEIATVNSSSIPIYKRLIKNPEYFKKALKLIKNNGFSNSKSLLEGKINAAQAIGYSASGQVIAIGDNIDGISVGDMVACAGAGYANHAEVIDVPVNLVVKLHTNDRLDISSTVTLGAIAIQGVRRAQPQIGDIVVVYGLGILGQITAQLLKNSGCQVIGVDISQDRIDVAINNGLDIGINVKEDDLFGRIQNYTHGFGSDIVIITAAAKEDQIVDNSMKICRRKGKVVLVGNVSLNFSRDEFYRKEIDFLISTSYGPGRYDIFYEEFGNDYPYPYVRWTENRNMQEYLRQVNSGKINLDLIINTNFSINDATSVYENLKNGQLTSMLVILKYFNHDFNTETKYIFNNKSIKNNKINVAIVGAGGFAQSTHLPNLDSLKDYYKIYAVSNKSGVNSFSIGQQFNSTVITTDYNAILSDPNVDLVMICTRHNLHAKMVVQALEAGKLVFVEKPLATSFSDFELIKNFYINNEKAYLLMTGFNRRFSEAFRLIKSIVDKSITPIIMNYKMNGGFISNDSWIQTKEGGGRNIGEACHIYDLFNYLTNSKCISVSVDYATPSSPLWRRNDNFVATLKYNNGSLCTLTYTSMGTSEYEKEFCEIFFDGQVILMNDFKKVTHYFSNNKKIYNCSGKGHKEELFELANSIKNNDKWPITLEEQFSATEISLHIENQINN